MCMRIKVYLLIFAIGYIFLPFIILEKAFAADIFLGPTPEAMSVASIEANNVCIPGKGFMEEVYNENTLQSDIKKLLEGKNDCDSKCICDVEFNQKYSGNKKRTYFELYGPIQDFPVIRAQGREDLKFYLSTNGTNCTVRAEDPYNILRRNLCPECLGYEGWCKFFKIEIVKSCCCKAVEVGAITRTSICKEVESEANDPSVCQDILPAEYDIPDADLYLPYPMPKVGGCTALESVSESQYQPLETSLDLSAAKLQADAATSLNPLNFTSLTNLVGRLTKANFMNIGAVAMIMYIWAGFLWMTAQGNSERVGKAKLILIWTTLGVVVILASYMLVSFVFRDILQLNV